MFRVLREDDNGNRFLVAETTTRADAEQRVRELEAGGHRQMFWIDPPRFSPRRPLGRTGFEVTQLGIGDLADATLPFEDCVATLRRALDAGLNLVDTAPAYEAGLSERIVGAALRGRREGAFVIDKIDHLDEPVAPQVEKSFATTGLDVIDLFVFHNLSDLDTWRRIAAPGGGMEQLGAVVREGRVRFRGISSHHPDVLAAALDAGTCDVVMLPIGPWVDERYEKEILPRARALGVGTVAFKTFGAGKLLGDTEGYSRPLSEGRDLPRLTVDECVAYTLSLDPDVALLGLSNAAEQDAAFGAAERARPLSRQDRAHLRARAGEAIRGKGRVWWNPDGA